MAYVADGDTVQALVFGNEWNEHQVPFDLLISFDIKLSGTKWCFHQIQFDRFSLQNIENNVDTYHLEWYMRIYLTVLKGIAHPWIYFEQNEIDESSLIWYRGNQNVKCQYCFFHAPTGTEAIWLIIIPTVIIQCGWGGGGGGGGGAGGFITAEIMMMYRNTAYRE